MHLIPASANLICPHPGPLLALIPSLPVNVQSHANTCMSHPHRPSPTTWTCNNMFTCNYMLKNTELDSAGRKLWSTHGVCREHRRTRCLFYSPRPILKSAPIRRESGSSIQEKSVFSLFSGSRGPGHRLLLAKWNYQDLSYVQGTGREEQNS